MIKRIESGKRMSQAVVANGFVFLAGQVANDTTGSVENQTRQVLDEIDRLLALAGSGKEKILSANIYLANMADFAAMKLSAGEPFVGRSSTRTRGPSLVQPAQTIPGTGGEDSPRRGLWVTSNLKQRSPLRREARKSCNTSFAWGAVSWI